MMMGVALGGSEGTKAIPAVVMEGTLAWKQGIMYRWIEPKDFKDGAKPRASRIPPRGFIEKGRTPQETLQVIGKPSAKVPQRFSIDIGVTDAFITDYGKRIDFAGHGVKTDVGKRLPEPTKGMSVNDGGEALEDPEPMLEITPRGRKRLQSGNGGRKPKKKLSWLDQVGSVKGYRPGDF